MVHDHVHVAFDEKDVGQVFGMPSGGKLVLGQQVACCERLGGEVAELIGEMLQSGVTLRRAGRYAVLVGKVIGVCNRIDYKDPVFHVALLSARGRFSHMVRYDLVRVPDEDLLILQNEVVDTAR